MSDSPILTIPGVGPGTEEGQTLRWNTATGAWDENSILKVGPANSRVEIAPGVPQAGGALKIFPVGTDNFNGGGLWIDIADDSWADQAGAVRITGPDGGTTVGNLIACIGQNNASVLDVGNGGRFSFRRASDSQTTLHGDDSGLVGIGTGSPNANVLLTVAGNQAITNTNTNFPALTIVSDFDSGQGRLLIEGKNALVGGLAYARFANDLNTEINWGVGGSGYNVVPGWTDTAFVSSNKALALGGIDNTYLSCGVARQNFVRLNQSGNVIISSDVSTAPAAKLQVVGNTGNQFALSVACPDKSQSGMSIFRTGGTVADPFGIIRITATNSVDDLIVGIDGSGTAITIDANGDVKNRNNSYGSLSDIALKENITDATPKLEDILALRIVNFDWKDYDAGRQIGVIAQEAEQVFPSLVQTSLDEEGNEHKAFKYSVLVPILVKAVQELNAKVESLGG